jgi:hypothetical protein
MVGVDIQRFLQSTPSQFDRRGELMTTFSFKDAAILAHLSRNRTVQDSRRSSMTSGLSKRAATVARTLKVGSSRKTAGNSVHRKAS